MLLQFDFVVCQDRFISKVTLGHQKDKIFEQSFSTAVLASRVSQTDSQLFSHHQHVLFKKLLPHLFFSVGLNENMDVDNLALHHGGEAILVEEHEIFSFLNKHRVLKGEPD